MFAVANKFVSVVATIFGGASSSMLASDSASNTEVVEFSQIVPNIGQHILNAIYTFFYNIVLTIGAFALSFIDMIQLIIYKFLGINLDLTGYKVYDPNNPIIKFITNDTVTTVLRSALSLALVLVIVFSIFAIIRGEYNKAANDQEYSVKRVWARALRAIFGMLIFPALFLGIIILSNAILSSFAYVLSGSTTTTMGNQVIAVSAYNANVYRNYAQNNRRIPIYVDFEDPYDKGYADRYSKEELVEVYDAFVDQGTDIYNMFVDQDFPAFKDTYTLVNNSIVNNKNTYGSYEKFICTQEQYYVMAEFIDYALTNNVKFYYKPMTDVDIDWQYVDDAVFDKDEKSLTITYQDAQNMGEHYSVSYKSSSYELTSPVQDAISSLETLLSLDGTKYKILDYIEGSINRVQWASNKVKIKLSPNYNKTTWTVADQIILYEYYRWSYNNTFQNYTLDDLKEGVYIDLYNIELQFFRTYQNRYVTLAEFDSALINGTYYKVVPLLDDDGRKVYDEYGDLIYQLDTTGYDNNNVVTNLSLYNQSLPQEEKLGVHIECRDNSLGVVDTQAWYSATYDDGGIPISAIVDEEGLYRIGNVFYKSIINTKGRKFAEATEDSNAKFGYVDANGFYKEVERVKATRSVKEVSWPSKLIGDLKALYRELNINQLITTGEWLETFTSKLETNVTEFMVEPGTSASDPKDIGTIITNLGLAVTSQILSSEMRDKIVAAGINYNSNTNYYYFGEVDTDAFNNKTHALWTQYSSTDVAFADFKSAVAKYTSASGYVNASNVTSIIAELGASFAIAKLYDPFKQAFDENKNAIEDGTYYVLTKQSVYNTYESVEYSYMVGDEAKRFVIDFAQCGVTRTNWLDNLKASVPTKTQEYVATFDTSLISPQGLIFSEIFLGEIAESDGSTLGNYMFVSKYTDAQLRSMMLALLGEEYYETATITINYFVDMFNQLFAPLLEKIMAGEGQPMTVGEVINIQLYTYKAYLASVILSDDSARFMLDIARSFLDMYAFSYDIYLANPNDKSFAVTLVREYADSSYGPSGIPYMITLEELDINDWRDYYSAEDTAGYGKNEYKKFLRDKFGLNDPTKSPNSIQESDIPAGLLNKIQDAASTIYLTYADIILSDNIRLFDYGSDNKYHRNNNEREDMQYGLVWQLTDGSTYELGDYLNAKNLYYDEETKYIVDKSTGKIYHTWRQLNSKESGLYDKMANAVYQISSDDMNKNNPQTRFVQLLKHANAVLEEQHVSEKSSSYPEYLKIFKQYITGDTIARQDIVLSEYVKIDRIEGIYNEYKDYKDRLEDAQEDFKHHYSLVEGFILAWYFLGDAFDEGSDDILDDEGKVLELLGYAVDYISTYYFDNIDSFLNEHRSDGYLADDWKKFNNKTEFMNCYQIYKDGVKDDKAGYKEQNEKLNAFVSQVDKFYEFFFYGCEDEVAKEARKNASSENKKLNLCLSVTYKFSSQIQNLISSQNMMDSFNKYFLTYSVRMQATEKATRVFTVLVNNHAYNLSITMPTAKLVEYVIGGQYLQSLGFETMFTDIDYTGFLDVGYGQKLPKIGEPASFGTINKFLNNLATITVDAYYASNLKNLTDANREDVKPAELYYGWSETDKKAYVIDGDNTQPSYLQLILQNVFDNDMLSKEKLLTDDEWDSIKKTGGLMANDVSNVQNAFDKLMSYLTNSSRTYHLMNMKDMRLEMLDALYNYQTYSSDSAEDDIQRYVTLFRLFCSDFEYTKIGVGSIVVEYRQNQASKGIMMRLSGLKDKPEELMVNLEYKSLYDDVGYDEQYGDYFIICSFDEIRQCYYPILMTGGPNGNGQKEGVAQYYCQSNYYYAENTDAEENVYYPVIAKGIITEDGYPTAIRQINGVTEFYRKNVIIRNASDIGLSAYYMSVEQVSVSMNIFQRFTNSISKLFTGKTLIERAYSNRKMIKINSNISFPMGVETESTKLTSEGVSMHYYSLMLGLKFSGLPSSAFYATMKIDIVTLIIAILALIPMLLRALWGVFGRVLDITVYYMASPVVLSTMAMGQDVKNDKGNGTKEELPMFVKWRDELIKKTLAVFGYVFAFQMFFILIRFINQFDLFIVSSDAFTSVRMFSWVSVSFVNQIIRVVFLICSVYLLTSAPKLFASLLEGMYGFGGGDMDAFAQADAVKGQVKAVIDEYKDTISGKKVVDAANFAREEIKQMIPGYDIAVVMKEKYEKTKAKVVGAVTKVVGSVVGLIYGPEAGQAIKKAGEAYKQETLKMVEAKKALREEKRAEAQAYIGRVTKDEYYTDSSHTRTKNKKNTYQGRLGYDATKEDVPKMLTKAEEAHLGKALSDKDSAYNEVLRDVQKDDQEKKNKRRARRNKK